MDAPLLRVSSLGIRLNTQPLLRDISFSIAPGSIVGLFGESGSGKTTLALSLLNLLSPLHYRVEGGIQFEGCDLLRLSEREWQRIRGARISMVPQDPLLSLNPVLRVWQQVEEVRRAHSSSALAVAEAFDRAGLPAARRRAYPHELSGGERQRVLLAQALICRPALIIADEPFTALDPALALELATVFRELRESSGVSFLIIGHSPGVFTRIADDLLVMYGGSIVERGMPRRILGDPLHPYTLGLLRSLQPRGDGRLYSIPGNPPDMAARAAGCPFEPRCEARMDRCLTALPPEEMPDESRSVRCFKYAG